MQEIYSVTDYELCEGKFQIPTHIRFDGSKDYTINEVAHELGFLLRTVVFALNYRVEAYCKKEEPHDELKINALAGLHCELLNDAAPAVDALRRCYDEHFERNKTLFEECMQTVATRLSAKEQ
jgi:hypothetical protein